MLQCSQFFGELDPAVISALARRCSTKVLQGGVTLFRGGDVGDALYGIRRGQIAIEVASSAGRRITLSTLGSGDVFGELALLDGRGRSADAVAITSAELFVLHRNDVLGLLNQEPTIGLKLISILCQRLRSLSVQLEQSLTLKLDARLAARLRTLAEDYGWTVTITQEELARSVGATRESVNRQLRLWEKAGALEIRRGGVVLKHNKLWLPL